jgi:hypothetical protein
MMFSEVSILKIFQVQSSDAVATICFLMWRAMPPIPLVWASIFECWERRTDRGSYSLERKGLGLASSGYGVTLLVPLPRVEEP